MDEFMVSGETIVRDLQFGHRAGRAARRRDADRLPPRHVRARRADAADPAPRRASSTRSCGAACPRRSTQTAFWWDAPDGSRVRCRVPLRLVLERPRHPRRREAARAARPSTTSSSSATCASGGDMLLMNGTDHQMPQPWLGRVVAEANAMQDDYRLRRHVAAGVPRRSSRPTGLPTVDRRAALGRTRERAHGRGVEPRRRAPGVRGGRARARTAGRAAGARCSSRRRSTRTRCSTSRGATSCSTARTTRRARAATTRSSTTVVVRYQEARQIGDGLVRDALHALGDARSTRPPASTIVVNPTARDRGRASSRSRSRATGPCHFVALDDGTALPDAGRRRRSRGEGYNDDGHRPEGALGARPDARHRVRGPRRSRRTTSIDDGDEFHDIVLQEAGPGEHALDLAELQGAACSRSATTGATIAVPASCVTPLREVLFDTGPVAGLRLAHASPVVDGDGARAARSSRPTAALANEHLRVDGRPARRHVPRSRRPTASRLAGLGRLVDGGDGGDTYNYSPPADGPRRRRARRGARHDARDRAGAGPRCASTPTTRGPRTRSATSARARRAQRRDRGRRRSRPRSSCAPASGSCASRTSSTTACATTGCASTSRCPRRSTGSDAECAFAVVHRGLDRRRRRRTSSALPDVPVPPVRRRVRRRGRARAAARRPARVRGRRRRPRARAHAAAGDRLPVALRAVAATEPGRPARSGRRPAAARRAARWSTRCSPTAATGAPPTATARPTRSSCRSNASRGGGPGARRPASGSALRVDGAEVSAVHAHGRRRCVCACSAPPPTPGEVTIEHEGAPARGWIVDLARPAGRAVRRRASSSDPWEICTLQLA